MKKNTFGLSKLCQQSPIAAECINGTSIFRLIQVYIVPTYNRPTPYTNMRYRQTARCVPNILALDVQIVNKTIQVYLPNFLVRIYLQLLHNNINNYMYVYIVLIFCISNTLRTIGTRINLKYTFTISQVVILFISQLQVYVGTSLNDATYSVMIRPYQFQLSHGPL